jgi:hypothetical protein
VRTMSGQVHTVACPDGPKTLVAHVKQKLAPLDPKYLILQQLTLVLPCEASSSSSSSSSSADPSDPALADDRSLETYDLSNCDVLDLFLVDVNWSNDCKHVIELIKDGGQEIIFSDVDDDELVLAVSWALVNSVCLLRLSLSIFLQSVVEFFECATFYLISDCRVYLFFARVFDSDQSDHDITEVQLWFDICWWRVQGLRCAVCSHRV